MAGRSVVHAVAVLLLSWGCATGVPMGARVAGGDVRYRPVLPMPSAPRATVETARFAVLPGGAEGESAQGGYRRFIEEKREALARAPEEERGQEEATLKEMEWWLWKQEEAQLEKKHPLEVYLRLLEARRAKEKRDAARWEAVQHKLEEYDAWAKGIASRAASQHFRKVGRGHLLEESPVWEAAQHELVSATLAWAYRHTEDVDFLRKSPSEVALYLLATRSALATKLVQGQVASPSVDYTEVRTKTEEEESDDEVRELLVGLLPGVGDAVDALGMVVGFQIAGRRQLTINERLLCAAAVLLPLASAAALEKGALAAEKVAQRIALATGGSLEEARVLLRVAQHLSPEDAQVLERVVGTAKRTGRLTEEEWAFLQRTARNLEGPLTTWREALKRGERVPFINVRKGADGLRWVPGSEEHLAQTWVEYQFRNPEKYPRFLYAPDEGWKRMYRAILENKGKGGAFEQEVLKLRGHEKNAALLMPPPGSKAQGFIPDAVVGNSNPGELVWGQPYFFVEVKARSELSLTGNLKAMLEYIQEHGGHIELWIRSTKHPDGPSRLTAPLRTRLRDFESQGKATVRAHP
ncbi:hypothetical protein P2318_30975 [Myxococcaceae bacterium GXIMD 01537]